MQLSAIFIFGLVWGGLMIYFFTPTRKIENVDFKKDWNFQHAFKDSLISIGLQKKAVPVFLMLVIAVLAIWSFHSQLKWHNEAHGGGEMTYDPTVRAVIYIVGFIVYSTILYLYLAYRRAMLLLKK
ncbi:MULTISPECIES: hypothetical protein [Sutcliffiella]|uniref:Uncharacterized protein n=1 Tax=Sutcliffiella cohnii TaxID=33932 RepID=A0A223KP94_9BACI|nr:MULTISPECIES: hypothetical protein [Sutcliffiella]AST91311.1 hypothetical protein BC6307_08490 [Sutcliffiella cohnii]WBL17139.1 hypothetical protein O1A01_11110 [Sutcliffiella sp. NC1]